MALFFFALLFISAFLVYHFHWKRRKLPPGPTPLPFIGNIRQIKCSGLGERAFLEWRRQYGPVFTYWLGNRPVVCVADYPKMADTFLRQGEAFAGRDVLPFEKAFRGGEMNGVIRAKGDRWREQRRFALHTLRDFGVGKNLMEQKVFAEPELFKPERFLDEAGKLKRCDELIPFSIGKSMPAIPFNEDDSLVGTEIGG